MAAPSVSYTFSNSTTADAGQVNTNFSDLIAGLSDGTKDLTVSTVTQSSTSHGTLPPRLTTTQRDAVSSPAEGETIYNTTDDLPQVYDGTSASWVSQGSTRWESFTPTGTWVTNTTYAGKKRRVGGHLEMQILVTLTGDPGTGATALDLTLPSSGQIYTTALVSTSVPAFLGIGQSRNGGVDAAYTLLVAYQSATTLRAHYFDATSGGGSYLPISYSGRLDSETIFYFSCSVPIVGWNA